MLNEQCTDVTITKNWYIWQKLMITWLEIKWSYLVELEELYIRELMRNNPFWTMQMDFIGEKYNSD